MQRTKVSGIFQKRTEVQRSQQKTDEIKNKVAYLLKGAFTQHSIWQILVNLGIFLYLSIWVLLANFSLHGSIRQILVIFVLLNTFLAILVHFSKFLFRFDICKNGRCKNSKGGFTCQCTDGYTLTADGQNCEDNDECKDPKVCPPPG